MSDIQEFEAELAALCYRYQIKLGAGATIKDGKWRAVMEAFRIEGGRCIDRMEIDPISPKPKQATQEAQPQARPVFGERQR